MNKYDADIKSSLRDYYNKYNLTFDPDKYLKQGAGRISKSYILDLDDLPDKKKDSNIKLKYSFTDISRIFFELNPSLQKGERPKGVDRYYYIPSIMTSAPRGTLDHFKDKKERRERAQTFYEPSPKQGYELYPTTPKQAYEIYPVNRQTSNISNVSNNITPKNANCPLKFTFYNPGRKRIGSYNLIN